MFVLILSIAICLVLLLLAIQTICRQFEQLPGPREWPLVGSSLEFVNLSPVAIFDLLRHYSRTYGRAYKISFGYEYTLVFSKPEIAEKILNTQSYATKSEDYDKVAEWIGYGLLISRGEKWFTRRKILTPGFHFKILESFVRVFGEQSDVLCSKLGSFSGAEVDVFPNLKLFTLDVLCETALGYRCNAQTQNSFYPLAVEELASILNWRFFNLYASFDVIFKFTKESKRFRQLIKETHDFTLNIISQRRKSLEEEKSRIVDRPEEENENSYGARRKMALLDILLQATVDGKPLSDEDIREEVDTFTFAGHDTTASALTFLLYNIAKHPVVQQKLYDAVCSVVKNSKHLDISTLNNLPYLDLVIKETLRLFPPVPMIARLATENTTIEGMNIPVKTCVCIDIYGMHRDPEHFEYPEQFNPERFAISRDAEKSHPFTYIPFSAGNRNCIGQKFAQYELKTAVIKLLEAFRLELPTPNFVPTLKSEIVLKPAEKLPMKFIARSTNKSSP
ncbi:cytochrome P450 4d2-like [Uranotaenia lowii]|uniref:cytochrome P450 4d2-like n=1 Tax=Uranotaenia lowii TaxID=190385 RepID=UPI00247B15AB|nr:cytochrome P450 4d2-like [Uranotaenia lowii]